MQGALQCCEITECAGEQQVDKSASAHLGTPVVSIIKSISEDAEVCGFETRQPDVRREPYGAGSTVDAADMQRAAADDSRSAQAGTVTDSTGADSTCTVRGATCQNSLETSSETCKGEGFQQSPELFSP